MECCMRVEREVILIFCIDIYDDFFQILSVPLKLFEDETQSQMPHKSARSATLSAL